MSVSYFPLKVVVRIIFIFDLPFHLQLLPIFQAQVKNDDRKNERNESILHKVHDPQVTCRGEIVQSQCVVETVSVLAETAMTSDHET